MEPVVQTEALSKSYEQGTLEVCAVDAVDIDFHRGDFAAFAGPSGSGKTTLLNLIGGLTRPTGGRVLVEGNDLAELSKSELSDLRLRRIGFIFQAYNLIPVLTAYENAEFILLLQKVDEKERRDRVMTLLETVGLAGLEDRFPRELSGGQQQRVAIARAMAAEPALILADEPTANLDTSTAGQLLDLMEMLNQEKQETFLFSTHDPAVMKRARRLIRLRDGAIDSDSREPQALPAGAT